MKRNLFERVVAALGFIAVSPLLAVCAVAVYLEDRGPVLFRQLRMGANGKPFLLLKLRTMRSRARGRSITAEGDSRITAIGKLLRDFKIDELPQLWNVFRGDMSFVGPRPEVPEYVDLSDPRWRVVLSVKPGITDLASLVFRHEERLLSGHSDVEKFYRERLLPQKLDLSAHYVRTRSPAKDARLIALTLRHVFLRGELDGPEIARQFSYGETLICTN
jgi:lipopolysaccharide/colanic/teichoic acid biosynthesis glycosyltransferase